MVERSTPRATSTDVAVSGATVAVGHPPVLTIGWNFWSPTGASESTRGRRRS
jgi:hypothetical protein